MHDFLFRISRRVTPSVRGLVLVGVLALVALLGAGATLEAAPVTFGFEAEITSITRTADATFGLPSNATIGDALSGVLGFEPFGFGQSVGVSNLKVNLGMEVFSVEGAPLTPSTSVFSADPIGLYLIRDSIDVGGCPSFDGSIIGACAPVLSSSSNDIELAHLRLWLSSEIVQSTGMNGWITHGESLGNTDAWNRLSERRVFVNFTSSSSPGSIQLEATIGPMVAIPEPSGLMLILIGALSMARHLFTTQIDRI